MKNRIRIARGTAKRLRELNNASNLPAGVPLFTTDDKKLHIGDDNTLPKNVLGINATGAEKLVSFDYSGDQAVQSDVEVGDTSYPVYFEDGIPKQCANSLTPLDNYNTAKGTIEERLTNLGFKQGDVYDDRGVNIAGHITRQGNYVLFSASQLSSSTSSNGVLFKINDANYDFVPKITDIESVDSGIPRTLSSFIIAQTGADEHLYTRLNYETLNGTVFTSSGSTPTYYYHQLKFGYEALPIVSININLLGTTVIISTNFPQQSWNDIQYNNLEIHYTTDGSDVSQTSPLYTSPIELSGSLTTIKAVLYEKYIIGNTGATVRTRQISKQFENTFSQPIFTLTASANNGTISATTGWAGTGSTATKTITTGNQYGTLPNVSRLGYTFTGWYTQQTGGSQVNASTTYTLESDSTIYAHWTSGGNTGT